MRTEGTYWEVTVYRPNGEEDTWSFTSKPQIYRNDAPILIVGTAAVWEYENPETKLGILKVKKLSGVAEGGRCSLYVPTNCLITVTEFDLSFMMSEV